MSEIPNTSDTPTAGEVREQVWVKLMKARALAYPYPPFGHHPNFRGAGQAAKLLLPELLLKGYVKPGQTVLSYPDYVLKGMRKGLLEAGVNVVVSAKYGKGYRFLDSSLVKPSKASTIAGAEKEGEMLYTLPEVALSCIACVAVSRAGDALTKGYGFTLPEKVKGLPIMALVHPLQVLETLPPDLSLSAFATPETVIWTQ